MTDFDDILTRVSRPSRYLGGEAGSIIKEWDAASLRVCLAFPDLYEVGTSHFGMQILYHLANRMEGVLAERVFAPAPDLEAELSARGAPLFSLESRRPLSDFDLLGFSLLYELNYPGVLTMLHLSGIPFYAVGRGPEHPVIIAGGPCMVNPEPVAEFFDAIVVGEGEEVFPAMLEVMAAWKAAGSKDRGELLLAWSRMEGVYVPSLFSPGPDGRLVSPSGDRVRRALVPDLSDAPFPVYPVVPWGKPVHDRLRLEVARGCARGCRFCQAGMIYRPARERSDAAVARMAEESLAATGYDELSLLSLSVGDHSRIGPMLAAVVDRCVPQRVGVSFPSIRADTLEPALMEQIKRIRKTGFTIAPEAGSQRMRDVINKNVTEEMVQTAVAGAFDLGWRLVKLYFMIGLPTETDEDIQAIVELVERLKKTTGRRGNLTVSIGVFVPKPHTPFQWMEQISREEARRRVGMLRDRLRTPGLKVKWQDPEVSEVEGLVCRGGREISRLLVRAWELGSRLDGWSDHFDHARWVRAMEETGVGPRPALADFSVPLPWDHVDVRVDRDYFVQEWEKAQRAETTPPCSAGVCADCGVCDFEVVEPRPAQGPPPPPAVVFEEPVAFKKVDVVYSKMGPARYLGHLEMMNALLRALRRAGVRLKYSQGHHPMPKVSFGDALPMFVEGEAERFSAWMDAREDAKSLGERLDRELPPGVRVLYCGPPLPPEGPFTYQVEFPPPGFDPARLEAFLQSREFLVERESKKGVKRELDLKKMAAKPKLVSPTVFEFTLVPDGPGRLPPGRIVEEIFGGVRPVRVVRRPASPV